MMNHLGNSDSSQSEERVEFSVLARAAFSFLLELEFKEVESSSSHLLFRKGVVDVNIYHGRRSFEIGAGVSIRGEHYSFSEILAAVDPAAAKQYSVRSGRSLNDLVLALDEVASLLRQHATRALIGDPTLVVLLSQHRLRWSESLELDVLARQLRPKAEDAFRRGDYSMAAHLYGRIRTKLSPSEERKLSIAEVRAKGVK
jgi:hypothetical protein